MGAPDPPFFAPNFHPLQGTHNFRYPPPNRPAIQSSPGNQHNFFEGNPQFFSGGGARGACLVGQEGIRDKNGDKMDQPSPQQARPIEFSVATEEFLRKNGLLQQWLDFFFCIYMLKIYYLLYCEKKHVLTK